MQRPGEQQWSLPSIDLARCQGHGRCVEHCPTGAVILQDGRPFFIHPELCAYCGICEDLCPEGAIALSYVIGGPK